MAPHSKGKGGKHLSTENKNSIIAYKDAGIVTSEIATWMCHDRAAIKRVLAAMRASLRKVLPKKKGLWLGKKKTEDLLVMLKRQIKKYPAMGVGQMRELLPELTHLVDHTIQYAPQKHLKMPQGWLL
jgi:hypothetical protein